MICILQCSGSEIRDAANPGPHGAVQNLIKDWTEEPDDSHGTEGVKATVIATDDGVVFDLKLNDLSVGFIALRTIVSTYPNLRLAPVIAKGELDEDEIAIILEEYDHRAYLITLAGEIA